MATNKHLISECDSTQIEYFTCKIFECINTKLQTPISRQSMEPYEATFKNNCVGMHAYGAEIEFSIAPTLRADKYYSGGTSQPSVICQTTIRSYFNDHVEYKTRVACNILENINNRFIVRGHTPRPILFASGATNGPFNIYGISVGYPHPHNEEKN